MTEKQKYQIGDRLLLELEVKNVDKSQRPYSLKTKTGEFVGWFTEVEIENNLVKPKTKIPELVVVPAFIDNYIRYAKVEEMSLFIAMDNAQNKESEWIITNEETFVRAWLDGYNIEEQKYIVEIPNPESEGRKRFYLGYNDVGKIVIVQREQVQNFSPLSLTEKEIKRSHAWAWEAGLAKPVEEVE